VRLEDGKIYTANVEIEDFEKDSINFRWEILPESTDLGDGGDYESRPRSVDGYFVSVAHGRLEFKAPRVGNYRLFVYADDGHNHAATANIPFQVH
jgi:hypothetical protein